MWSLCNFNQMGGKSVKSKLYTDFFLSALMKQTAIEKTRINYLFNEFLNELVGFCIWDVCSYVIMNKPLTIYLLISSERRKKKLKSKSDRKKMKENIRKLIFWLAKYLISCKIDDDVVFCGILKATFFMLFDFYRNLSCIAN